MAIRKPAFLLDEVLRRVVRRYRLPAACEAGKQEQAAGPSEVLATAIEEARTALERGVVPEAALEDRFLEALAQMIREAMHAERGDPAFQAMVLRHRVPRVREYASLSAHADRDRRRVRAAVDAVAHPAKLQRSSMGPQRDALAQLHALASSGCWPELAETGKRLLFLPEISEPSIARALENLLRGQALERLQRLAVLASDEQVQEYQVLWNRNGPRSGSRAAAAQGSVARQRGAAVEASAARALEALAVRLNQAQEAPGLYRVVTSMHVPASIPGNSERAKSEWDAVLLRQANTHGTTPVWDVCLLVEVKASVDAATTDFPRLLRGLRLLAHAHPDAVYPFATRQGEAMLRGESLSALPADADRLRNTVLYCCDAAAEPRPRRLNAASRMQLMSAGEGLAFASRLAEGQAADARSLAPVWRQLLESPQWHAVLHQYDTLRQVRELMVHIDDLSAAIDGMTAYLSGHAGSQARGTGL